MEKAPGGKSYQSHDATGKTPTLTDLGITKSQSSRWQIEASVPGPVFEEFLDSVNAAEQELTSTLLIQLGKRLANVEKLSRIGAGEPGVKLSKRTTNISLPGFTLTATDVSIEGKPDLKEWQAAMQFVHRAGGAVIGGWVICGPCRNRYDGFRTFCSVAQVGRQCQRLRE